MRVLDCWIGDENRSAYGNRSRFSLRLLNHNHRGYLVQSALCAKSAVIFTRRHGGSECTSLDTVRAEKVAARERDELNAAWRAAVPGHTAATWGAGLGCRASA